MNLFLFANFFPYKKAEPFLVNEFEFAKKRFASISLFTLYGKESETIIANSDLIKSFNPILESSQDKSTLFLNGVFNFAPFDFHLKEIISKKIFLSPTKAYWFFVSLLLTRLVLASKAYKQLIKKIDETENPVLYFYWADNLCWIIPYLKRNVKNKRIKIVLRLHGSDLYENLKGDYAPLRTQIFSNVDLIVPISEHGRHYLSEKYPAIIPKLFLSRLGVFDNGLNPTSIQDKYHIVSVSNMVALKRLHLIFEALEKTDLEICWHHFGDGPLENQIKKLALLKRKKLEITFHGFVSNQNLIQFYKTQPVHLFLNTSSTEGLPVSIMEALSFGIPIIATRVGGTSELVSDSVGALIDSDFSTSDLARRIENLLQLNSNNYTLLRENARNVFEEKVNASKNYELFYDKISV